MSNPSTEKMPTVSRQLLAGQLPELEWGKGDGKSQQSLNSTAHTDNQDPLKNEEYIPLKYYSASPVPIANSLQQTSGKDAQGGKGTD